MGIPGTFTDYASRERPLTLYRIRVDGATAATVYDAEVAIRTAAEYIRRGCTVEVAAFHPAEPTEEEESNAVADTYGGMY